jgi:galactokinase
MTGGGFGGCTVTLIQKSFIPNFSQGIIEYYQEKTGIVPHVYISRPAAGAEQINIL